MKAIDRSIKVLEDRIAKRKAKMAEKKKSDDRNKDEKVAQYQTLIKEDQEALKELKKQAKQKARKKK